MSIMKSITVTRKKKFASAVMPYWIITRMSKADFCAKYGLEGDMCEQNGSGFPVPRIDINVLDELGTRINNGETVCADINEGEESLFVSTMDGCLSNEVRLEDYCQTGMKITVSTKGGFATLPHPVVE